MLWHSLKEIIYKFHGCYSLVNTAGQAGIPQQRLHDRRGSRPRLYSEQKDQKCTVGAVQLHPGSVSTHSFTLLSFILFSLAVSFSLSI